MKKLNFKTISQMHEYFREAEPENPLFSILHTITPNADLTSCEESAEPVSICNQYFSRLFKKKTGMSPKAYIENATLN